MAQNNYNWPINPTTVNAGPIQIEIDGIPQTVNIDKNDPDNSVSLPTTPFARILGFQSLDASIDNIDNVTPVELVTVTEYISEIEIFNTTGTILIGVINGTDSFVIGTDGLRRQAMALVSGSTIEVKCLQSTTADSGIIAINLFQ